ncbi:MAG: DNA/RNA non-specific endonuclease [Bacteroidales bacterium]|mgnify:CR=1 FL=1|nr:DNA/RNA non-specific endonuclease [Bacteroidales bacterium]
MKGKKKQLSILLSCLVIIGFVAGMNQLWSCKGNDKLPSEASKGFYSMTSAEKNEQFAAEEAELTAEEHWDDKEIVAPYENLEQPAEISGDILIFKSQFIISYNLKTRCPDYVCWALTKERAQGGVPRSNEFRGDPVMNDASRVESFDYNGSGYDRGHMCPAADNKNSQKAMEESFYMTNICPQDHNLNIGAWNDLEIQCREWARNYGTLYICCGPIFDGKQPKTIGSRHHMKIAVPDRFFKVILALGHTPKAIGFIYPNKPCNGDMRDYSVSVDEVERITGYDFFPQLDDKIEREVEKKFNPASWGI